MAATAAAAVVVAALVAVAVVAVALVRVTLARRISRLASAIDPGGSAGSTASLARATTYLERAVERLRESSAVSRQAYAQLQVAADALPLGVVVAGPDEQVLMRNAAAARFVGVRHADVLVEEAVTSLLGQALRGSAATRTLELYGPPRRTVLVRAAPVHEQGVDLALALIEDVTERARLEAMRTDFVANISHELRTPVGALALLAETMVDEREPALMRRLAEKMVAESTRVTRIIEDLLELSRLEHDGGPEADVVNVGLLMVEAVDRVRVLAEQRRITMVLDEPARQLCVAGDRRQLVSALANLVENGVKYSDPGSEVILSARVEGCFVQLSVQDHGIGIPARDQDRIFERFYRVDRARARDTGGTGLGLAIVRHVATSHGGTVTVESVEGVGSTFTIEIPVGLPPVPLELPEAG